MATVRISYLLRNLSILEILSWSSPLEEGGGEGGREAGEEGSGGYISDKWPDLYLQCNLT